jgi:hypothetical protein
MSLTQYLNIIWYMNSQYYWNGDLIFMKSYFGNFKVSIFVTSSMKVSKLSLFTKEFVSFCNSLIKLISYNYNGLCSA